MVVILSEAKDLCIRRRDAQILHFAQDDNPESEILILTSKPNSLTFQELILKLQAFYAERGAVIQQPYDVEVGAGTMA